MSESKIPKIAILHPYLNVQGGAERKLLVFYQKLNKVYPQNKFLVCDFDAQKTFTHLIESDHKIKELQSSSKFLWMIKVLKELIAYKPHFIFVSNYPANIPAGIYLKLFPRTKVLWLCNEVGPSFAPKTSLAWKIYYWFERYLSKNFDQYIGNSDFTSSEIYKYYGVKAKTIRSGIELKKKINLENVRPEILLWKEKPFYFSLQRVVMHKNIGFLAEIAQQYQDLTFLIGGVGKDRSFLEGLAKRFKNIIYLGSITEDEKFFLYKNAMAFLFLPKEEPLGVTVLESLSQNTPVLAFNKGGPKETVLNGKNGILVDEENQYLQSVQKISSFKNLTSSYGEDYIFSNFTNEIMVQRFLHEVDQLIEPLNKS